jgi:hypothetical protein
MSEYKCHRCGKVFELFDSLRRHVGRFHKINSTEFYVEYNLNGIWPECKCGCGGKVKWSHQLKGFREYCQGHQARVHNNWGHNQNAIEKSAETRRQQYASGERKVWNDGLTIDDERVKNNGIKVSDAFTDDRKDMYSDIMRKNRLDGTVPTLRGPDHPNWKGGVSEINVLARSRTRLYKEWKFPILVRDGFKCVECGKTSPLHVHHDKEQMCEIVARHIVDGIEPKTFDEKEFIADAVVDYHIKNNVSGVTLCDDCHNKIHPSLNFV